jgi:hypothetical protein
VQGNEEEKKEAENYVSLSFSKAILIVVFFCLLFQSIYDLYL